MKAFRIYFSNGKDVRVEADNYEITKQGHLRLFNQIEGQNFIDTVYVVNVNLWTIVDIAPADDEDTPPPLPEPPEPSWAISKGKE